MKLVSVNKEIIGEKLAYPVYNRNGMLYINSGTEIKESTLKHIKKIGIKTVYVEGESTILLEETIESRKHLLLIKKLKEEFVSIKKNSRINEGVIKDVANEILENINISENAYKCTQVEAIDEMDLLVTHSLDVAILSVTIGLNMNYTREKLINLSIGALLHDVGKLLDSEDDHVTAGTKLARENKFITPTALTCIHQHHENCDSSGFPKQLNGESIYEFAKIVNICNEHINAISRDNKLPHESLDTIVAKSYGIFDKDIVEVFSQSITCYPNGLSVELNDGSQAIVVEQNKSFPQRPVLKIDSGTISKKVNLLKELTFSISAVSI